MCGHSVPDAIHKLSPFFFFTKGEYLASLKYTLTWYKLLARSITCLTCANMVWRIFCIDIWLCGTLPGNRCNLCGYCVSHTCSYIRLVDDMFSFSTLLQSIWLYKYSHCSLAHSPSVISLHFSVYAIFQASKIMLHHFTFCLHKAGKQHPVPYFMISLQKNINKNDISSIIAIAIPSGGRLSVVLTRNCVKCSWILVSKGFLAFFCRTFSARSLCSCWWILLYLWLSRIWSLVRYTWVLPTK